MTRVHRPDAHASARDSLWLAAATSTADVFAHFLHPGPTGHPAVSIRLLVVVVVLARRGWRLALDGTGFARLSLFVGDGSEDGCQDTVFLVMLVIAGVLAFCGRPVPSW